MAPRRHCFGMRGQWSLTMICITVSPPPPRLPLPSVTATPVLYSHSSFESALALPSTMCARARECDKCFFERKGTSLNSAACPARHPGSQTTLRYRCCFLCCSVFVVVGACRFCSQQRLRRCGDDGFLERGVYVFRFAYRAV